MSDLHVILPHLIATAVMVPSLVILAYVFLGKGLGFKIYGLISPVIGMIIVTVYATIGLEFGSVAHLIATVVAVTVVVGTLAYLYRITVKPLREFSVSIGNSSTQLSSTAVQSASLASQQSTMATQVGTTVEEITQTSSASARSAQDIVKVAAEALEHSKKGQASVQEALEIMTRISRVRRIVDTVNKLAEQSNLLAVNAGIEAAKAGEHGRGFAVVAAAVSNLAERSNEATQEIRDAIELTTQGEKAIETTAAVIQQLVRVVEDASDRSRQIASAAVQQAAGIEQINDAAVVLSKASQDSAASTKQIEQSSADLKKVGERLRDFIGGRRSK